MLNSVSPKPSEAPVTDRRQLVEHLEQGEKPPAQWRIGTEHEKFAYRLSDLRPLPYDGPDGIGALLEGLARFGWQRVDEAGKLIALSDASGCSVTLEPGGQVELSGAPLHSIHETCDEVHQHLQAGTRGEPGTRHRHDRPGLPAEMGPLRRILDAQRPLSDHARLHAQARHAGARHDEPNLHSTGQSGLCRRSGHGPQVSGRHCAAARGDGAVRQLALHRKPAKRLPELSQPHLDRHRPGPLRRSAAGLRGRLRLRALCRLRARCADVFRLSGRHLSRCLRPVVPGFPRRSPAGPAGRNPALGGLGRPSDDGVPGGSAEALS